MRERRGAVERQLSQDRRGDRRRQHRRERGLDRRLRVRRARRCQSASTSSNRAPARKFAVSATGRPSSCARSQCRDAFSATGPLMPKCVQSSEPVRRIATAPSTQTASSTSCETPDSAAWTRSRARAAAARAPASSARWCGRVGGRSRSRRRRCRSSAATGRRSRARRRRRASRRDR